MRIRITEPTLVRSTDYVTNGKIKRDARRHMKKVEKTRALGVFIKNAFGTKNRFIYISQEM